MEFYNKRGTAEQYIKEGKHTFNWTRLSCKRFRDNQARLQLHALAYNLTAILRNIELPEEMKKWSLATIQLKLIKVGARFVRHARAIIFQLAEVAVTDQMINSILKAIYLHRNARERRPELNQTSSKKSGRTSLSGAPKNTTVLSPRHANRTHFDRVQVLF